MNWLIVILLQLGPNVTIGRNVSVGAGVRVRESMVLQGVVLQVSIGEMRLRGDAQSLWMSTVKCVIVNGAVIFMLIVSPVRSTYGGYYGLVVVTPPRPRPPRPQTLHRSHDNLKNPYRIASIFYM